MAGNLPPLYEDGRFSRLRGLAEAREEKLIIPMSLPLQNGGVTFGASGRQPRIPGQDTFKKVRANIIVAPDAVRLRTEDEEAIEFDAPARIEGSLLTRPYHPFADTEGNDLPVAVLEFAYHDTDRGLWEYIGPHALHSGNLAVGAVGVILGKMGDVASKKHREGPEQYWHALTVA